MASTARAEPPAAVSDDVISQQVMARLNSDQELGPNRISVSSRNGVVHLRGTVQSAEAAKRAINLAEANPGVRGVWVEFTAD